MVSSSTGGSLIRQLIDTPGNSNIFQNPLNETSNEEQLTNACNTCKGIGVISEYAPTNNLTNIPSSTTQTLSFCCNDPKKAINRARSINTHINKKYYSSTQQYLNNRCHTFEQQQFNYLKNGDSTIKPGGPKSIYNNYVGNCNPNLVMDVSYNTNPSGCKVTNYKPNNSNFATQGAVLSSDRTWKLNVNTINTNKANIRTLNLNKSKYFEGGSTKSLNECCVSNVYSNDISLKQIAFFNGTQWELATNITIYASQTLTLPSNITLLIPFNLTLTNFGSIIIPSGSSIVNNGTLNNNSLGTIENTGTLTNNSTIEYGITNAGTINNKGTSGRINNNSNCTITNTGTITNNSTNANAFINTGTINNGTSTNTTGFIDNKSNCTITNTGTITNKSTTTDAITNSGTINNSGNTGFIDNKSNCTITNTGTITNNSTYFDESNNLYSFTNNGTIYNGTSINANCIININTSTSAKTSNFLNSNTGTIINYGTLNNNSFNSSNGKNAFTNLGTITNYRTFVNNSASKVNNGTSSQNAAKFINNGLINGNLTKLYQNGTFYNYSSYGSSVTNTNGGTINGIITNNPPP
jgi:hypothetical protein